LVLGLVLVSRITQSNETVEVNLFGVRY